MELHDLIEFAEAYQRLGWAVQEQLRNLLNDPVYAEVNPNARDLMKTLYANLPAEAEDALAEAIEENELA